jgi:hypothetical protein
LTGIEFIKFSPFNSPEVTRLILVASGVVSRGGKERGFVKDDLSPETLESSKNDK